MREIKFRAWAPERKELFMCTGCWFEEQGDYHEQDLAKVAECFVLMQYTGLKDKNGVEIYEGDIIATHYTGGTRKGEVFKSLPVKWGTYNIGSNGYEYDCYVVGPHVEEECLYSNMIEGDIIVIGNIHENPELLKEEK